MEQNIGIVLCVCTCFLCLLEVILFGYSIYKKSIVGIIIHILGIAVSALFSILLVAYLQKLVLPFESGKVILGTVIAGFVFAIAVSIKSLFRDTAPTQNERIKEKRKKLKEISDSKADTNDNDTDEKEDSSSNKSEKKSTLSNDNDKRIKDAKKDNDYNNSCNDNDEITMVKRSQKGRSKKKNSKKKHK